ncbi:ankyrin repeat domain-containing protein 27-like [Diadema antillarum]|uniref:ankyrin repeat domain-containing protein 27-like n=1 Tax=Diadema antillarum TaxID=105358 RepID=UPI003A88602E
MDRAGYDEDITENRFFTTLQSKHKHLYQKATQQRCMICVPRTGVFTRISLSQADFENHILQPQQDEQLNVFHSLNKKQAKVTGTEITTGEGYKEQRVVRILFDETFYNDSEESFRVLCIDRLLEGGTNIVEDPVLPCLETYEDCCEFLWGNKYSKASHKKVDELIEQFCSSSQRADILRHIIDATGTLFTKCIQIALKDVVLRTMQKHAGHMDNLKIAMETYIMNAVYTKVFKAVSQFYAAEDANLNKITRNLSELQVKDVGVRAEFTTNVPRARRELSTLNKFSTPLGKMQCLRRTVLAITRQGFRGKIIENSKAMSSDDLLPLLVFLVVKSDIPNWLANLSYMQNFCLSNFAGGEFGFYMASIEAAVEHVKSGAMSSSTLAMPISVDKPRLSMPPSSPTSLKSSESLWQRLDATEDGVPSVDILFQRVIEGKTDEIESMLEASSTDYSWLISKMCHPLCACDKCEQILASKRNDPRAVTASSRDNRGCTPMHAAAAYGYPDVVHALMRRGGEVNATDYHGSTPLHLACQRGHQHVTLLLLAKGAMVGIEDNDGNRPLHLCSANGHEECVKALLYSTRPSQRVCINATNTRGDTALHLASRWGYANIVTTLIDHGASVEAKNRRQETPLMCSHNINISRAILFSSQNQTDGGSTYATSPPIASILSTSEEDLVIPHRVSVVKPTRLIQPGQKEVEKLLRSVADNDLVMMKHHLGWLSDSDFDDDDDEEDGGSSYLADTKLCHPLCQCSKCAMLQKCTRMNTNGLSVNSCNQEGYTALHVAALHGHETLIDTLLRRGANPNNKNSSSQQSTPLHLACQCNHPKVVAKLLLHGAKCNIKDSRGNTPLHYCCLNGHVDPAEVLIQHGASVNQINQRGNSPLHEAARFNFAPLVRLLLDLGQANPHLRNKAQQIPLRLTQKRSDIAQMLKMAMRRDDDVESVTSTETNTSSGSSQADPTDANQEAGPLSPDHSRSAAAEAPAGIPANAQADAQPNKSSLRPLSMHEFSDYFGDTDRSSIRALNQSIREFEPARQLRHVEVEDKQQLNWNLYLRHQLEIQHFDRRKLRRAKTEDKSGPFLDWMEEHGQHASHVENVEVHYHGVKDSDTSAEGSSIACRSPEPSDIEMMSRNVGSGCHSDPTSLGALTRDDVALLDSETIASVADGVVTGEDTRDVCCVTKKSAGAVLLDEGCSTTERGSLPPSISDNVNSPPGGECDLLGSKSQGGSPPSSSSPIMPSQREAREENIGDALTTTSTPAAGARAGDAGISSESVDGGDPTVSAVRSPIWTEDHRNYGAKLGTNDDGVNGLEAPLGRDDAGTADKQTGAKYVVSVLPAGIAINGACQGEE